MNSQRVNSLLCTIARYIGPFDIKLHSTWREQTHNEIASNMEIKIK